MAFDNYICPTRPMTPDDVLAVLVDCQRRWFGWEAFCAISFEMPVDELELGA